MGGSVVNVDFEQYGTGTEPETKPVAEVAETLPTGPNPTTEVTLEPVENAEAVDG